MGDFLFGLIVGFVLAFMLISGVMGGKYREVKNDSGALFVEYEGKLFWLKPAKIAPKEINDEW